jgi:hypothetical protein
LHATYLTIGAVRFNFTDGNLSNDITEILTELGKFIGSVHMTAQGLRIKIPNESWHDYGLGKLDKEQAHNFRQLAWIQISQFDQKKLQEALANTLLYNPLSPDYAYYGDTTNHKSQYVNLTFLHKTYIIINQWISDDIWYDPQQERIYPQMLPKTNIDQLSTKQLNNCIITDLIYDAYAEPKPPKQYQTPSRIPSFGPVSSSSLESLD